MTVSFRCLSPYFGLKSHEAYFRVAKAETCSYKYFIFMLTLVSCIFSAIMIFDGKFQVTRGDVFTTGLKYNHTSVYQQKVDYYRNLITESLEHNGLTVYKCDIHGFGTGPLVQVDFRVFLDMRKVPR